MINIGQTKTRRITSPVKGAVDRVDAFVLTWQNLDVKGVKEVYYRKSFSIKSILTLGTLEKAVV